MKKITSLFMMVFLLVGTFAIVAAEETEDAVPELGKVGFFSNQMFKLKYAFTFNKEKKIDQALEMAERRLAEAELLAEEDPEAYEKAQARYNNLVIRAEEVLADIEDGDGDTEKSEEQLKKMARIQNKFERHRDHSDEIYARAAERLADNNASAEKLERFEQFHERAMIRSEDMEKKLLEKKENAVRKHKALSEMSDEELEELLTKVEEGEGLTQAREKRIEQFEVRTQKLEDKGFQISERVRERLENAEGLTEEQKVRLETRIQDFEGRAGVVGERVENRIEARNEVVDGKIEDLKNAVENELASRSGNESA